MNKALFLDPLLVESFGALQATLLRIDLCLRNVILEGDFMQVIKAITNPVESWTNSGMLVSEIKNNL